MLRAGFTFVLGVAAALVAGEVFLRVLPVSTSTATGYHLDPLIVTYPPNHEWTTSTGWDLRNVQRNRSNNDGFLAHRDFAHDARAVALIGDSYVESSMLPADARPGQQLEKALGGRPVYAMGGPGSSLLDYAERIRLAQVRYGIRDFVLLVERGDVQQSLCGSGNVHGVCIDRHTLQPRVTTQTPPGTLKRVFRHSALAQYVFGQLKADSNRLWRQAIQQSRPVTSHAPRSDGVAAVPAIDSGLSEDVGAVVSEFFSRVNPMVAGRLVIVVDSNRSALQRGESVGDATRTFFLGKAQDAGALVIDTEPVFRAHFVRSPLTLDVGPFDRHMNALGVQLSMQAAAQALVRQGP